MSDHTQHNHGVRSWVILAAVVILGACGGLRSRGPFTRFFPPTVPNGAIACSKDQGDPQGTTGRDLSGFIWTDAAMTNSKCRAQCAGRGFQFAGTQVSDYCFCGDSFGRSGPATNCTDRCSGNFGEVCGGVWANSVSVTGAVPTPPSPPGNGVQCVIDIKDMTGQGYRYTEIQRWEVTGPAAGTTTDKLFPMKWSTTGSGFLHEGNPAGTARDASWGISGTRVTDLRVQQLQTGWGVQPNNVQTVIAGGLVGTQQQTINGTPRTPGVVGTSADEFRSHFPINAPGQPTQIVGTAQFTVGPGGDIPTLGFQKPASVAGIVNCQWHLTVGP